MTEHKADISAEAQALFEEMRRAGLAVPDIDNLAQYLVGQGD